MGWILRRAIRSTLKLFMKWLLEHYWKRATSVCWSGVALDRLGHLLGLRTGCFPSATYGARTLECLYSRQLAPNFSQNQRKQHPSSPAGSIRLHGVLVDTITDIGSVWPADIDESFEQLAFRTIARGLVGFLEKSHSPSFSVLILDSSFIVMGFICRSVLIIRTIILRFQAVLRRCTNCYTLVRQ